MKQLVFCLLLIIVSFMFCPCISEGGDSSAMPMDFDNLTICLVNDALDLIPHKWANKITSDGSLQKTMNSLQTSELSKIEFNESIEPRNLGIQAARVINKIWGGNPPDNFKVPQVVYYDGFKGIENIDEKIRARLKEISGSKNELRDKYSLALNLITDIWINNFIFAGENIVGIRKKGVYIRDSNENLYLYEEGGQ
jgi:hypothetical protein